MDVAGCALGRDLPPLPEYRAQSYRLGGGQMRIITFGEDQLAGEFRMDDQGRLAIPLLGGVQAVALTQQQLEAELTLKLKANCLLRDFSVSVEVLTCRPIFMLGKVVRPNQYPYQSSMTVLTMVAIAEGFTHSAVYDYSDVIRTTGSKTVEDITQSGSFVSPGDVVKIFERRY